MCGIAGIFSTNIDNKQEYNTLLNNILLDQENRGPDNKSRIELLHNEQLLILGHNRLSILDLSNDSNQPMVNLDNGDWIVYNGEVYNYLELKEILVKVGYTFTNCGDTQVLLKWLDYKGLDGLNDINGMFAFAWYQAKSNKLFLARDRFGVKPLYYFKNSRTLAFASTSSQLAKFFKLDPNPNYLARGLSFFNYEDGSSETQYKNLYLIEPGSYRAYRFINSNLNESLVSYYNLSDKINQDPKATFNLSDFVEEFVDLFTTAVKIRLRSDVPVGLSLSGGLDSTSIAAFASELHPEIIGFSFGNENDKSSEGPVVARFSKQNNLNVNYVTPNNTSFEKFLWRTIIAQDAPFGGPSIIAQNYVYEEAKLNGIKVLLGGQGGDEGFMGYNKFKFYNLNSLVKSGKHFDAFIYFVSLIPYLISERNSILKLWGTRKRFNDPNGLSSNLIFNHIKNNTIPLLEQSEYGLKLRQVLDINSKSLPTLLRYEDRNSMNHSIESRLPYMDYKLIEFGINLPTNFKLKSGYGKWINRIAFKNKVPDEINYARFKKGFNVDDYFYNNGFGDILRSNLKDRWPIVKDYFKIKNLDIDTHYSDDILKSKIGSMGDIITALWLSTK